MQEKAFLHGEVTVSKHPFLSFLSTDSREEHARAEQQIYQSTNNMYFSETTRFNLYAIENLEHLKTC